MTGSFKDVQEKQAMYIIAGMKKREGIELFG